MEHRTSVAILASGDRESGGGGSTMARFIRGTQEGEIDAEVGLVVCNNPRGSVRVYDHVDALNREFGLDIEVLTINGATHPKGKNERGQTDEEAAAICAEVSSRGIWHIMCLGYMKQVNGELVQEFGWKPEYQWRNPEQHGTMLARMTNTHPGILPTTADTHGVGASQRAMEAGLYYTAHTLHVVAAGIDTGPTIAQHPVRILSTDTADTLFARVQAAEKANLCSAMDVYFKQQREFLDGDA